ncbi:hypothetical protein GCM10009564_11120 [Streptomyces thermogriseus]|jgi:hypothetical protein|uniref:Lipoprotein n=2 Tax=Streptomyces TaxID=1883 RepID=A0ABP4DCD5_9ACTN
MAGAVLAAGAVGGVVACDPGGLNTASVAYTTDRTATAELNRQNTSVRWLDCTGRHGDGARTSSASGNAVVTVDCRGETRDGRKITVTGEVTRAVDGACVRGNLVAEVGGKELFRVSGLGNCEATARPTHQPPVTRRPAPGQPGPTVTVTVTRTIWCPDNPACGPVQGK